MKRIRKLGVFLLAIMLGLVLSSQASAHALLQQADPSPGAHLSMAPKKISLTFNERMEKGLYDVKVFGQNGKPVTNRQAEMSKDRKQLILNLPTLTDGIYTISYNIISIDGHPVEGSYMITVGNVDQTPSSADDSTSQNDGRFFNEGFTQMFLFAARIFYYLVLLGLSGWILWSCLLPTDSNPLRTKRSIWLRKLTWCFLFSLLIMIGLELVKLERNFGGGADLRALLGSNQGISWTTSLCLSIPGFFVLRRSRWGDIIWVLLVLAAESMNGHAAAFKPAQAIVLDFVHLLAAAVWSGGLLYLLVFRQTHQEHARFFLPRFSRMALLSIVVLTLTGIGSTFLYLPKPGYVFHSLWGKLLIAKAIGVLLVTFTGAALRQGIKRRGADRIGLLLKVDFGLMALIIGIVGIFTCLNPIPVNEPLHWVENGKYIRMEAAITPNTPGPNRFQIQLSLPNGTKAPKRVQLLLKYLDNKDVAPMEISFTHPKESDSSTSGYTTHTYTNDRSYIPFPGKWDMEIRIMDANDDETVYRKLQVLY